MPNGFNINGSGDGPRNVTETLRAHRWYIVNLGPIDRDDALVAKELSLPEVRFDRQEVLAGAIWYKFAKSAKWDDMQVSFYDNGTILEQIQQWQDLVFTSSEGIKSHDINNGYKKQGLFRLLNGCNDPVQEVKVYGAWPAVISPGKLSYADSQIKIINLTIAYDYAETQYFSSSLDIGQPGSSSGFSA